MKDISPIKIEKIINQIIDIDLINDSKYDLNLETIGLDSINFIKVIVSLEDEFEYSG